MDTATTSSLSRQRSRAARIAAALVAVVVAVFVVLMAVDVVWVHSQSGQWRLWPTAAPPKVVFRDRDYHDRHTVARVEADATKIGKTLGGAKIYGNPISKTVAPTVIFVRDHGTVYEYALVGGP